MVFNGLIEMFSVASVVPFLGVAANPGLIQDNSYLRTVYDFFGFSGSREFLLALGFALIFAIFLSNLSNAFFTWFNLRFTWSINESLSVRLIQRYMTLPYVAFIQRNSADLQKNIQTEVMEVATNVINPLLVLMNKGIALFLTITLLVAIDPLLASVVGVIFATVYILMYVGVKKALTTIGQHSLADNEAKFRAISEALGVFKIAKLLHLEPYFIRRFSIAAARFCRNQSKRMTISQLPRFAVETVAFTVMIGICLFIIGVKPSFGEAIPIIGVYAFAAYRIMPGMQQVYSSFSVLRSCWPHVTYLNDEFEFGAEARNAVKKHRLVVPALDEKPMPLVKFRAVTYRYPNARSTTIDEMSFSIFLNTTVGFIGETGSGKSTTIDLILGILTPDAGTIFVDGEALLVNNLEAWQKSIGYVPQDIYLTDSTIAENIAFGMDPRDVDMEQVKKCCELANIASFIEKELAHQYQTTVGERGVRLSGGQRQRIGIARALYYDPKLLVFDEATSALDSETERSVMDAIGKFFRQKTIIIIAHRLTTLEKCDTIFKIDKGRIVDSGTFEEIVPHRLESVR